MPRVMTVVLLLFIFNYRPSLSDIIKEGCFTLYTIDKLYDLDGQTRSLELELVCSSGHINLQYLVFSIPRTRNNYCLNAGCYNYNGERICNCCSKPDTESMLSRLQFNPRQSEIETCSGKRNCSFVVHALDLSKDNRRQTSYNCITTDQVTGYQWKWCYSRWVEVHYLCLQEKTTTATTLPVTSLMTYDVNTYSHKTNEQQVSYTTTLLNPEKTAPVGDGGVKDEKPDRLDQQLIIGLSVGICVVTLPSVVTIAICHLRYKRLHRRYKQQHELNSGPNNVATNAPGEPAESCGVLLFGDKNQNVVKYASNSNNSGDTISTGQNAKGVPRGEESMGETTYQNVPPDTISSGQNAQGVPRREEGIGETTYQNVPPETADAQHAVYAQVQDDLKKKNRSADIDGSNHWTNSEQGKKGDKREQELSRESDLDMVDNVYYERSAWA